jgi:RHS repeat-associated protein
LNDGTHSYAWDAQGNLSSVDSVGLVYDAMGRMVEQSRGTSYTQIVYSPTGDKIALMNGQLLQKAFIGLPGGATAVYGGSGLAYYQHPDWLGSSRIASTPSRAMYADSSYGPFGEPYAPGGSSDISFTHEHQDTVLGLYDFLYREYSSTQGRWISCDPIGSAAADSADPQSWNKYGYARNNPLSLIDPSGLDELPPCKDLIIMGIKDTSTLDGKDKNGDMAAVQELAKSWGYNVAFPYSNMGAMSSILDVFKQGQGATTAATKDAQEALQYTINNGGTTVINFSGGAQAYASAMAQFNSSAGTAGSSGKIENVIYLSPGSGGSQLVTGTQSTERYNGGGIADTLTNLTAPQQAGVVDSGGLDHCKHSAKCELENYLNNCGEACKNSPCNSQIFARKHSGPRENPGGSPRPPDQPGYNIGERCSVGPESGCMDFIYWSWGGIFGGGDENPGGRGSGFWHPPFW